MRSRAFERAQGAVVGRFEFLSRQADLGRPVAWDASEESQLWRYQLHYFDYLLDMLGTGCDWRQVEGLISEWISACQLGEARDPWHPFVASERLVNWLFAVMLGAPSLETVPETVWRSLSEHATFIDRNLEEDVGGNHLLKNLKAMSVASCVWSGSTADRWRDRYVTEFDRELSRQLLADGAHYERSPMYHLLVLNDAIDVIFGLRLAGHVVPESLAASVRAMAAYIPVVTHPDGEIALFNDSVLGEAPPPASVQAAARACLSDTPEGLLSMRHALLAACATRPVRLGEASVARLVTEDSGIVRVPILRGRGQLLVDVGRACPDDLPAHAHADFFSFELSVDGQRVIVDSGVGDYAAGPWRDYYRSTRAHNTVSIDETDQIECWGSFRVARRASVFDRAMITGAHVSGVAARHDGYRRLRRPVLVGRSMIALDDQAWLVLDQVEGTGPHTWQSYLHAVPEGTMRLIGPTCVSLTAGQQKLAITWFGAERAELKRAEMDPRQGWYAPEFGRHIPNWTLVMHGNTETSTRFGYLIAPDLDPGDVSIADSRGGVSVRLRDTLYDVSGTGTTMAATRSLAS